MLWYFHVNTTKNGKWKRVYSQFLSPMIQLYTKATVQSGGMTPSVQRDLIALTNRPSSRRSPIFFHWSDRGIVRVFFCYSAVLRVVRIPSLPSSTLSLSLSSHRGVSLVFHGSEQKVTFEKWCWFDVLI